MGVVNTLAVYVGYEFECLIEFHSLCSYIDSSSLDMQLR